jgi:hypothetical protein
MGKQLLVEKIRGFIGSIGFSIFLWSVKMNVDEYHNEIIRQSYADEYP